MSESKYTPGPWEHHKDAVPDGWVQITVYAEADNGRVATVFRADANATLIAAAPDLLEACKAAERALKDYPQYDNPDDEPSLEAEALYAARAAIAKATSGKPPEEIT